MSVKLLTEHVLEFLSFKGGCTGSYESTLVKMPHCWKSHVTAHLLYPLGLILTEDNSHDMSSLISLKYQERVCKMHRDFSGPDLGLNIGPLPIQK